ncbi:recombinase [Lentzea pudingi]|uniref:Recombinase n=1 Tax=Lentzea pudingi TaxID=1789439 RepID=A0ABQ2HJ73_9PSEU|nr:recombinase [Lentzea pudingi]
MSGPAVRADNGLIRVAFAARTSTYDQQDPTLSIPRQLNGCHRALPDNAVIVAHFYDIESGRKDLAARGQSRAHEMFEIPVPRDGGIHDLLEEAARPDRRFDVVICEEIGRVGRRAYISNEIERRLEQLGVRLIAADEPFQLGDVGRRAKTATQVLTRRVKQGVTEWYVLEMLEKSWDGFETHTQQGYNVGKACYGFRADPVPHPVPAKRAKGIKKTRLLMHPIEGPCVQRQFQWRTTERLGYQAIADRLNEDLALNPPPTPVEPDRAVGFWTYSSVRDILTNPKYTGHMVWNRRARKGAGKNKVNPVSEWVWSVEPTHEALISLETFVQAQQVSARRERSRTKPGLNPAPESKRVYRLRSYTSCVHCHRRLFGNANHAGTVYYGCQPKKAYRPDGHPPMFRVREDELLIGVNKFLAHEVFGPYRRSLFAAGRADQEQAATKERADRIAAIERALRENRSRSTNLLRTLEVAADVTDEFVRDVNNRRVELQAERTRLEEQLEAIEVQVREAVNPELLDYLPIAGVDLDLLPDEVSRPLFEALRLEIHYDYETRTAVCRITLTGDTVLAAGRAATEAVAALPKQRSARSEQVCVVPPAGFEPALPPPEGGALSPELRGP